MTALKQFFQANLDIVFFVYGLAFVVMGLAIFLQPRGDSRLGLARDLWLLALFGLTHGINELLDMWALLRGSGEVFTAVRWIMLVSSYAFLFEFGKRLFVGTQAAPRLRVLLRWTLPALALVIAAAALASGDFLKMGSNLSRYLLGFPGGVLAGLGLIRYAGREAGLPPDHPSFKYFGRAGGAFLCYAFLGGLVVSPAGYFPADTLNTGAFLSLTGVPVQVFRALCALAISYGLVRILSLFNWETQEGLVAAREAAEAANRSKSQFLAGMSHELRTPLNSVIGFSEVLEDRLYGPLNAKQGEYVGHVLRSSRHLLSLINDVLDLAKVEAGKMQLEAEAVEIKGLLEGIKAEFGEKALEKNLSLKLEFAAPDSLEIAADARKLRQIMLNLLSNAVKFTPAGGSVLVKAGARADGGVEISVADTGPGIKAEDMPKLFMEFSQVGDGYVKGHEGTGLGLALTKKLVELHGGGIRAESAGPGRGAKFTFTLPKGRNA